MDQPFISRVLVPADGEENGESSWDVVKRCWTRFNCVYAGSVTWHDTNDTFLFAGWTWCCATCDLQGNSSHPLESRLSDDITVPEQQAKAHAEAEHGWTPPKSAGKR